MAGQGQVPRGGGSRQADLGQQVLGFVGVPMVELSRQLAVRASSLPLLLPPRAGSSLQMQNNTGPFGDLS